MLGRSPLPVHSETDTSSSISSSSLFDSEVDGNHTQFAQNDVSNYKDKRTRLLAVVTNAANAQNRSNITPFSAPMISSSNSAFPLFHSFISSPLTSNPVNATVSVNPATTQESKFEMNGHSAKPSSTPTFLQNEKHRADFSSLISPFSSSQIALPIPSSTSNSLASSVNSQSAQSYPLQVQQEEITTIFVVGFPEDMFEREFQNMFIFCPGFEAATLKIPSSTESADNDTASGSGRKQIIGFAKFRTRADALEARNILSGRKVDAERGCVLKAEMAKKNLHTKRGLSNEASSISSFSSQQVPRRVPPPGFSSQQSGKDLMGYSSDPFSYLGSPPIPRDLLNPPDFGGLDMNNLDKFIEEQQQQQEQAEQLLQLQQQIHQASRRTSPPYSDTNSMTDSLRNFSRERDNYAELMELRQSSGNLSAPSRSFLESRRMDSPLLGSSNIEHLEVMTSALHRSNSTGSAHPDRGFSSALYNSDSLLPQRMNDLRINTFGLNSNGPTSSLSLVTPTNGSPSTPMNSFTPFRTGADQNPPCNTLYVGNLPPNTMEQELLNLFSKCLGFKRLLFRNRPNGPMCFVEFDDVHCATLALQEHSGIPLSNSTKGGIRLSFSKNPLGVRQNPGTAQSPLASSSSHHLLSPQLFMNMEKESRLIHGH
ncbi:hypothetical protein HK098_005557 [Nowakowskiella sp. JEL0407]|nr:hypothetical protein HK098_005557 [Nowakowskiella sp. JEL0407]